MTKPSILYDDLMRKMLIDAASHEVSSDAATTAMKNLKTLSEAQPPILLDEATPEPTTVMGKLQSNLKGVWDSETTRVLIKASGAFAGVVIVTWTTIHRDHVVTRDALSQANLRNS